MDARWKEASVLIATLEAFGHEAYFVGGCVRDYILGRDVKDIDITTSALPEEVMRIFKHVIPTGVEHGTVLVIYKGSSFEVTTYRSEGTYTDKRRPDQVAFISDLKEDLSRRDFTINAMAMDQQFAVVDLFDGKTDLKNRQIKTVGSAAERFREDALRILRALRFASQLGFNIEEKTEREMQLLKDEVHHVAVERIKEECEKFFQGTDIKHGMALFHTIGLKSALPVFKTHPHLLEKSSEITTPFISFADVIAYYHYLEPTISIQTWIKQWKCSNKEKNLAHALNKYVTYVKENGIDDWLIYQIKLEHVDNFCHLIQLLFTDQQVTSNLINAKKAELPMQGKAEMVMNGHQIAAMFPERKKGRWIAEWLERIEYLIITRQLKNEYKMIKEWILCHPPAKN